MLLQLPLGIIYFTLNVTFISVSLALMAAPIIQKSANILVINLDNSPVFLPYWALLLTAFGGFCLLTLGMHLARTIGWLHGRYAKWMLVNLPD